MIAHPDEAQVSSSSDANSVMDMLNVAEVSFLQRSAAGPVRVWATAADDEHLDALAREVRFGNPDRDLLWNTFEVMGPAGAPCPTPAPSTVYVVAITTARPELADAKCRVSILDVFSHRQDAEAAAAAERNFEQTVAVIEFPVNAVLTS